MIQHIHHPQDEMLNAWIDNGVDPAEAHTIEQHLVTCETCASQVAQLRALKELLSDLQITDVPRSFRLTEDQAVQREPLRLVPTKRSAVGMGKIVSITRSLSVAAVLVFVVLAGSLFFGSLNSDNDTNPNVVTTSQDNSVETVNSAVETKGDSASGIISASDVQRQQDQISTSESGDSGDSSTLQIATMIAGILALLALAALCWVIYLSRAHARA